MSYATKNVVLSIFVKPSYNINDIFTTENEGFNALDPLYLSAELCSSSAAYLYPADGAISPIKM